MRADMPSWGPCLPAIMSSSGTAGSPCLTLRSSNNGPSCLSAFRHHLLVSFPRVLLSGRRTITAPARVSEQKAPRHGSLLSLPGGLRQRRPSGQQDLTAGLPTRVWGHSSAPHHPLWLLWSVFISAHSCGHSSSTWFCPADQT